MAATSSKGRVFFIFDHTVLQKEEDDLKDAIIYFYPQSVDLNSQCALCGQLMGMVTFFANVLCSKPMLYRLKLEKYAVKHVGKYTLALAGDLSEPDPFLMTKLETLYSTFSFYQGSLSLLQKAVVKIGQAVSNWPGADRLMMYLFGRSAWLEQLVENIDITAEEKAFGSFIKAMAMVWNSYLPFIRCYDDDLSAAFKIIPSLKLPKTSASLFLRASHMLQAFKRKDGVLGGCLFFKNKVLCSQLSPELTAKLCLIKPIQAHFPSRPVKTDYDLPNRVRLIEIFLTKSEYEQLDGAYITSYIKAPVVKNTAEQSSSNVSFAENSDEVVDSVKKIARRKNSPKQSSTSASSDGDSGLLTQLPIIKESGKSEEKLTNSNQSLSKVNQSDSGVASLADSSPEFFKKAENVSSLDVEDMCLKVETRAGSSGFPEPDVVIFTSAKEQNDRNASPIFAGQETRSVDPGGTSEHTYCKMCSKLLTMNGRAECERCGQGDDADEEGVEVLEDVLFSSCSPSLLRTDVIEDSGPIEIRPSSADIGEPSHSVDSETSKGTEIHGVHPKANSQGSFSKVRKNSKPKSLPEIIADHVVFKRHEYAAPNNLVINEPEEESRKRASTLYYDTSPGLDYGAKEFLDSGQPMEFFDCGQPLPAAKYDSVNHKVSDLKNADSDIIGAVYDNQTQGSEQSEVAPSTNIIADATTAQNIRIPLTVDGMNTINVAKQSPPNLTSRVYGKDSSSILLSSVGQFARSNLTDSSEENTPLVSSEDNTPNASIVRQVQRESEESKTLIPNNQSNSVTDRHYSLNQKDNPLDQSLQNTNESVFDSELKDDNPGFEKRTSTPKFVRPDSLPYASDVSTDSHGTQISSPASVEYVDCQAETPEPSHSTPKRLDSFLDTSLKKISELSASGLDSCGSDQDRMEAQLKQKRKDRRKSVRSQASVVNEDLNDMIQIKLYVQGHSDIALLLLIEKYHLDDEALVNSLYKPSLIELGDMEAQIKACHEHHQGNILETSASSYHYLHYDTYERDLKGNMLIPVAAQETQFLQTSVGIHDDFSKAPYLTDVTLRSHVSTVYGHRSVSHETYYQPIQPQGKPPPSDIPAPNDPIFCLEKRTRTSLLKDQIVVLH